MSVDTLVENEIIEVKEENGSVFLSNDVIQNAYHINDKTRMIELYCHFPGMLDESIEFYRQKGNIRNAEILEEEKKKYDLGIEVKVGIYSFKKETLSPFD
jgi:hypothetical protein